MGGSIPPNPFIHLTEGESMSSANLLPEQPEPDSPYCNEGQEMLSNCCGATSLVEIFDDEGICADCKEHATFSEEEF